MRDWNAIKKKAGIFHDKVLTHSFNTHKYSLLSGVPDYFGRNKISSGGDLSHYSSASLY